MTKIKKRIRFLVGELGLDQAFVWTNINTFWSTIKGPIQIFLIVSYLSIDQQGLWYTIVNLAALSVMADLGFTGIISNFVSHEYSHLRLVNGRLTGDTHYLDRLVSLVKYAAKFYIFVIFFAILLLSVLGVFYFKTDPYPTLAIWFFFH